MVNGIFVSNQPFGRVRVSCFGSKTTIWSLAGLKDKLMSCSINSSAAISPREIERPGSLTTLEIQSNQNSIADDVPE